MWKYSLAVLATVIVVRIVWVYAFAFLPRMLSARIRAREQAPTVSQVFIVAWAGMRGVVSLAAAFAVPLTTLSGAPFPGRAHIVIGSDSAAPRRRSARARRDVGVPAITVGDAGRRTRGVHRRAPMGKSLFARDAAR